MTITNIDKTQNNIEKAVAKLQGMGLNIFVSNDDIAYADVTGNFTIKVSGVEIIVQSRHCKSVTSTSRAILQALQIKLLLTNSYMEQNLDNIAPNEQ